MIDLTSRLDSLAALIDGLASGAAAEHRGRAIHAVLCSAPELIDVARAADAMATALVMADDDPACRPPADVLEALVCRLTILAATLADSYEIEPERRP